MGVDPFNAYEAVPHRIEKGELEKFLTCSSCGWQEWIKASESK